MTDPTPARAPAATPVSEAEPDEATRLRDENAELRRALKPFGEFAQTLQEWRMGDGRGNSYLMQGPWPRNRPVLQRDYPHESDDRLVRYRRITIEDFELAARLLGLKPDA